MKRNVKVFNVFDNFTALTGEVLAHLLTQGSQVQFPNLAGLRKLIYMGLMLVGSAILPCVPCKGCDIWWQQCDPSEVDGTPWELSYAYRECLC